MDEIKEHLEKLCVNLHDYVTQNFHTDSHQVRIAEIKFDVQPNPDKKENLFTEPIKPMNCHRNEQGQMVCTP